MKEFESKIKNLLGDFLNIISRAFTALPDSSQSKQRLRRMLLKHSISSASNSVHLFFNTLFYNRFCNWDYAFDTIFSPLFYLLDNYGKELGQAFVVICCILMSFIIVICYWIGLPYWWNKSPVTTICLLIFGNWLKMNCIFHYYMGVTCGPGYPPQDTFIEEVASVCKKCLQPKPHRTHHCSICNVCILQMDHHCPWLNNCVGHFNRRYFLMFMVYIEISLLFLVIFGIEIAYKELWLYYMAPEEQDELYGYTVNINTSLPEKDWIVKPTNLDGSRIMSEEQYKSLRRKAITFVAVICVGVAIAIGSLLYGHCKMISRGETSIEKHINNSERKKYAAKNKIYVNPYDFGRSRNWTLFLGIKNGSNRSWFHILFPSTHEPFGDGITWPTINSSKAELETFLELKCR